MARITTQKEPTVEAPFLGQEFQKINIPKGAFGQDVGKATERLGAAVEKSAVQVGDIAFRMQQRRDITEASGAAKDVPITSLADLEVMKGQATADPRLLNGFAENYINDFDKKTNVIRDGLTSDGAKLQYDTRILSTRTNMAKNAITWARTQEILVGRNNVNSEIQNEITVAGGDIGNLNTHKQKVIDLINQAEASGFLIDGRGRKIDSAKAITDALRKMDLEVSYSLITNDPAVLQQMLDPQTGNLPDLTAKDRVTLDKMATNSSNNIQERRTVTTRDSYFAKNTEFGKKYQNNTLTWNEVNDQMRALDNLVEVGDPDATKEQAMLLTIRNRLSTPEDEGLRVATEASKKNILATEAAKKELGIQKGRKPTDLQQSKAYLRFVERFLEFDVTKRKGQFVIKNADVRLSDLLDFQADIENALDVDLLTKAKHSEWMTKLLPTLRRKIESKHFAESGGFLGVGGRVPDKYSDAFIHVLDVLDDEDSQAEAVLIAFRLAEEVDLEKETDFDKRDELIQSIGDRTIKELNRQQHPELNSLTDEQMPNVVVKLDAPGVIPSITTPPQNAVDFLIANPTDGNIKFFNQTFGKGEAEKILGE